MRGLADEGRAPRVIAIENVEDLVSSNDGADFEAIVEALVDLGYAVGALTINAAAFVPQSCKRLFIVAAHGGDIDPSLILPEPAAPFHTKSVITAHRQLSGSLQRNWRWWRLPTPPVRAIELCDVLEPGNVAILPTWTACAG